MNRPTGRAGPAAIRVLVVEDDALFAEMLAESLTAEGALVVGPVGRIAPAVALARQEPLDGALLDVTLAGDDAGPIAEALCQRGIPFIFMTGHHDKSALPPPFRAAPCLLKPFAIRDLQREVACRFHVSTA